MNTFAKKFKHYILLSGRNMKKLICFLLPVLGLLSGGCSDEVEHRASGQWQLKTMEKEGVVSVVDTVFFAFQRGLIFSFTILTTPDEANVSYGYLEVPAENEFRVAMDTSRNEYGDFLNIKDYLLKPYGWTDENRYIQTFTVEHLEGQNMRLLSNGVVYQFKKH